MSAVSGPVPEEAPGGAPEPGRQDAPGPGPHSRSERAIAVPRGLEWRRMHPVTPLLEGWTVITAVLAFFTIQNIDEFLQAWRALSEHGADIGGRYLIWAILVPVALLVVLAAVVLLNWWARTYAVDRDAVYLRSGVLYKKLRIARLPRIQAVDVVHPLLGRIFGLGQLTVEVAGGGDSRVTIGYLRTAQLEVLRDRILDLAAGAAVPGPPHSARSEQPGGSVASVASVRVPGAGDRDAHGPHGHPPRPAGPVGFEDALAAPRMPSSRREEVPLYTVQVKTLIGATLRSVPVIASFLLIIVLAASVVAAVLIEGIEARHIGPLVPALAGFLGVIGMLWSEFNHAWGFNASATPSGIRMRYGLTSDTSSTLPPGRVHGVGLIQGLLWRGKDWWRVDAAVAGRNPAEAGSSGSVTEAGGNRLLPVGDQDTALRALWLVVPDLGAPDPDALLRAALYGLDDDGVGPAHAPVGSADRGFVRISPRARLFSPLGIRREAIALTGTCAVLRLGRWRRRVAVIPYARIQSVVVRQGPWARRRGLAGIRFDMVDATVPHQLSNLSADDAAVIERIVSARALERRRQEHLDRWLERVS